MSARARVDLALLALLGWLCAGAEARAQVVTNIVPDASAGTNVTTSGATFIIDGGFVAGSNLFHSFQSFDLGAGDTASWVGGGSFITNVINRVTGGGASNIDGAISAADFSNANFYFINPAGVMFGPSASINVPGGFHVSTASRLRFDDGSVLRIATPNGSQFTAAPVSSFGFVGGEGDISFNGTNIALDGSDLTVDAANVIINDAAIRTGSVFGDDASGDILISAQDSVLIANSRLLTSAVPVVIGISEEETGVISIAANALTIQGSQLSASAETAGGGGGATLFGTHTILISESRIDAVTKGPGQGGTLLVSAPVVDVINSRLESGTYASGTAGAIVISVTERLNLIHSEISSSSLPEFLGWPPDDGGAAGFVTIEGGGDSVLIMVQSLIDAEIIGGRTELRPADITIAGFRSVILDRSTISTDSSGPIFAMTPPSAPAGNIRFVGVGDLTLIGNSSIRSDSRNATVGGGGFTGGLAGSVFIGESGRGLTNVNVMDGSTISTSSVDDNSGGVIAIYADNILVDGASRIASENTDTGAAGSILLSGDSIAIANGGQVSTNAINGAAGDITFLLPESGVLTLADGPLGRALITTSSGTGAGGRITISNPNLLLADGASILALGEAGGANVNINAGYFIQSADNLNEVLVDGALTLDAQVEDVRQGAEGPDAPFVDVSRLLIGQCAAARESGDTSGMRITTPGPYAIVAPVGGGGAAGSCR